MLEFSAGASAIFRVAQEGRGVAVAPRLPQLDAFGRCALLPHIDGDGTAKGLIDCDFSRFLFHLFPFPWVPGLTFSRGEKARRVWKRHGVRPGVFFGVLLCTVEV